MFIEPSEYIILLIHTHMFPAFIFFLQWNEVFVLPVEDITKDKLLLSVFDHEAVATDRSLVLKKKKKQQENKPHT